LAGLLLFEVVFPQQMLDLVDRPCALLAHALPHRRQLSVFSLAIGRQLDTANPLDFLACQETLTIDPQELAQRIGVSAVGFLPGPLLGLDQNRFSAAVFAEEFQQPVVEAADSRIAINPPSGTLISRTSSRKLRTRGHSVLT